MPPPTAATAASSTGPLVDHLVTLIVTLIRRPSPTRGGPVIVTVDGRSGSGKTTFARELVSALDRAAVVELESMYQGWHGLAAGVDLWATVAARLAADGTAGYTAWDWHLQRPQSHETLVGGDVLVAEGFGSSSRAARGHVDLSVWLEAPAALRRHRALARDGALYAPWWDIWASQEDAILATDDIPAAADVTIDATDPQIPGWSIRPRNAVVG